MSQNDFTKENRNNGLPSQVILDAGLNVFALDLIAATQRYKLCGNGVSIPVVKAVGERILEVLK